MKYITVHDQQVHKGDVAAACTTCAWSNFPLLSIEGMCCYNPPTVSSTPLADGSANLTTVWPLVGSNDICRHHAFQFEDESGLHLIPTFQPVSNEE